MHILFLCFSSQLRTHLLSIMSIFCIGLTAPLYAMMPGIPSLENLSAEEMQQLEQELQAAAQHIDAYVNSLSPEEQAEFQRAVAEVEQMMGSMSEEELGQFFEQIIAAEMEQANIQGATPPQQQPITFEQKPAPIISKVPLTTAEEKALVLLTSLIQSTDEFLVKINIPQEMSRYFNQWMKKNKLSGISATTTWEQQKNSIEGLRQQLSDLKKTDLKTGKYLFLEPLIKNSTLYTQLEQLNTLVQLHEPKIVVSIIEKLNSSSKNSIQTLLNTYGSTLQGTSVDMKKLFEEIGPELAKIKEEEKKFTEKAQAEGAKGRTVVPGRTAGAQPMGDYGYGRGHGNEYDYDGGYGGGYNDYGPSRSKPGTSEKNDGKKGKDDKGGKSPKAGDKGKEEDKDKDEDKKDKEDKNKDKKTKSEDEKKETPKQAPIACPVDGGEQLNGKYQLIESNYRYIAELLQDANKKHNFDLEILLQQEPITDIVLSVLPSIERRLKRLNELVSEYTKQAQADWRDNKNKRDEVMNKVAYLHDEQEKLQEFGDSLGDLVSSLATPETVDMLNAQARYAYLKDSSHETKVTDVVDQPPATDAVDLTQIKAKYPESSLASLRDIYAEWQKLSQAIPRATVPKKVDKPKTKSTSVSPQKQSNASNSTVVPIAKPQVTR